MPVHVTKEGDNFQQVGIIALRDPKTREFLPSQPIYEKVSEEEINPKTKMTYEEERLLEEFARGIANPIKQYIEAGGLRAGI